MVFLIKKENLRLKEENSKFKARVENIENKLREAKIFELLFPVVVASMLTVWGYAFLFFFDEFVFEESRNAISDFHFASNEVSLYIKKLEFAIIVTPVVILVFFSYCIFRKRSSYSINDICYSFIYFCNAIRFWNYLFDDL